VTDPVDAVILAFLDHIEGGAPRPTLDHLADPDRERAQAIMDDLVTARGIDPRSTRPSIESLLEGTPLAGLIPALGDVAGADLETIRRVLAGVDARATVVLDATLPVGPTVVVSYLDLRARFLTVPAARPTVTKKVRGQVEAIFREDPDSSRVGVVAARGAELLTQLLSVDEMADAITTPRGEPHTRWEPPLPLALAARRLLEQSAPEWPAFDFNQAFSSPLDVAGVAVEIAGRVIARESARSYRGDKRRAYRALVGQEHLFADLVARISAQGSGVDLDEEITKIARAAA
jgi:hypothetical protein